MGAPMLMRRDFVPIVCYASLFAIIVAWAALGPSGPPAPHQTRAAMASGQLEPGREEIEVRYLAQRMLAR
ncbi:MAG: hypothetical protein JWL84_1841 [Rhodospirillales bacterium]|jgi:hypothetical protein|nr:hypothetical protein [Rhodospirillales bacterium]